MPTTPLAMDMNHDLPQLKLKTAPMKKGGNRLAETMPQSIINDRGSFDSNLNINPIEINKNKIKTVYSNRKPF